MKKLVTATLAALLCGGAGAHEFKVFCTDGKNWHWLPNEKVEGHYVWAVHKFGPDFDVMFTAQIDGYRYMDIKEKCETQFPDTPHPQPAKGFTDIWYTFSVDGELTNGRNDTRRPFDRRNIEHLRALGRYEIQDKMTYIDLLGVDRGTAYYESRVRYEQYQIWRKRGEAQE